MGKEIIQHFNMLTMSAYTCPKQCLLLFKEPVRLIKRVKIAHSSLQSVPFCHFKLVYAFYIWLSKSFLKPTSKTGDIVSSNQS